MTDDTPGDATPEDAPDADAESADRTTIRTGRDFEQTYRLRAEAAGAFLANLGEQLQAGEEITIRDEKWELPFAVGEPVTLEIDFEGVGDPELEIEVEIPGRADEDAPDVV